MVVKSKNLLKLLKFRGLSKKSKKVQSQFVENNIDVEPNQVDISLREEPDDGTEKMVEDDVGICDACRIIRGSEEQTKGNENSEEQATELITVPSDGETNKAIETKKTEDLNVLQETCISIGERLHNRIESGAIQTQKTEDLDVLHGACMAIGESVHLRLQRDVVETPSIMSANDTSEGVTNVSAAKKAHFTIGEGMSNVLGCIGYIRRGQSIPASGKTESVEGTPLVETGDRIEKSSNTDANGEKEVDNDIFHSTFMLIGEKVHRIIS